jgi:hypothetical protein
MAGHSEYPATGGRGDVLANVLSISVVLIHSVDGCIRTNVLDPRFAKRHLEALRLRVIAGM